MRSHTLLIPTFLSLLTVTACVFDDAASTVEESGESPDRTGSATEALAAEAPAVPSLAAELAVCGGQVADYLVTFRATGATSYDVEYRRGSGAWATLYSGAHTFAHFRTSNDATSVTFRARACNGASCSAYRIGTPFYPASCPGSSL